jgi:hypothetical protein
MSAMTGKGLAMTANMMIMAGILMDKVSLIMFQRPDIGRLLIN